MFTYMKKTMLLVPALAFMSLFGASQAQAFGGFGLGAHGTVDANTLADRFESAIQAKASLFGLAVADLKAGWALGKSPIEVAKEKGMTDEQIKAKLQAERDAQVKAMFAAMVSKGYITQAQADARLTLMKERQAAREDKREEGRGKGGHMGGWPRGMGLGLGLGAKVEVK